MKQLLKRLWKDESGQGLVEYALILALISVVCITVLTNIGTEANTQLGKVKDAID